MKGEIITQVSLDSFPGQHAENQPLVRKRAEWRVSLALAARIVPDHQEGPVDLG